MREKAKTKLPDLELYDGQFMHVPADLPSVDAMASTFAFHHLTDEIKTALCGIWPNLNPGGKIVFADTVFRDEPAKLAMQQEAEKRGFHRLATDLRREFYTTVGRLEQAFQQAGFTVQFKQLNRFVWLIAAEQNQGK